MEEIRRFKSGLYENMVVGVISKDEYKIFKTKYATDADVLIKANVKLKQEIDDALSCKTERLKWIEHFKQFASLDTINRKAVSVLVKSIRVIGKREIAIDYNFQDEYDAIAQMSGVSTEEGERTNGPQIQKTT